MKIFLLVSHSTKHRMEADCAEIRWLLVGGKSSGWNKGTNVKSFWAQWTESVDLFGFKAETGINEREAHVDRLTCPLIGWELW